MAILLGLAATRPASQTRLLATSAIRPAAAVVAGSLLIIGLGSSALMAYWNVGPEGLVARLRGETISLSPFLTDLGAKPAGEGSEFHLTVTNHSARTIHLVGGSASCSCAVLDELPIEIPAHESRDVAVRAAFKGTPGRFQHEVLLYTDVPGQLQMASRFGGVVTAAN